MAWEPSGRFQKYSTYAKDGVMYILGNHPLCGGDIGSCKGISILFVHVDSRWNFQQGLRRCCYRSRGRYEMEEKQDEVLVVTCGDGTTIENTINY